MKYKDWLDVWFANYIEPSSKTKTCERYSEIIEKHLKVKLGEYELEELSPIIIQKYITELMQSGNLTTGKGLAANSVNGIITVIQNSLKLAYTLGELKEYTTDKIRRPKTKEKEVSCFSLAEQKKIEQAALSNKKRKFIGIVICLYSGLRIGELLALTWADIDFTKGTLIDETTYMEKTDTIKGEIAEARSRRTKIINGDEEESFLEELRKLSREIEKDDFLTEFNRETFQKYIQMIIVEKEGTLSFVLAGDLKLTVDCER